MSQTARAYLMAVMAMAFWGMTFVWVKIALEQFQPVTILLMRLAISSLMLWSFLLIFRKFQAIRKQDYSLFLLSSLFQPVIYFIGETYGLSYVSSTLGAIMISTIPVFTPIGAWLAFRERLGWKNLAGFVFSFAGVMLMMAGEEQSGSTSVHGLVFLLVAVVAAIANSITVKKLTASYNPFMIVTMQNTIGFLCFIPLFFAIDFQSIHEAAPDWRTWRNVIALAIFGSTLAFIFFTYAIGHLGINRSGIFSNLIPVFTGLFAFLFLHEHFPLNRLVGMAVVIAGVWVVSGKVRPLSGLWR
jgi:drug/metabolite transporter (DMT)-like permease